MKLQLARKAPDLFFEVADGVLVSVGEEIEDFVLYVILFQVVHQVGPVALKGQPSNTSEVFTRTSPSERRKRPTFTCSLDVTAQKTISVNPCDGNIRKQIPPITRPSLISDSVLCFLGSEEGPVERGGRGQLVSESEENQELLTGQRPVV